MQVRAADCSYRQYAIGDEEESNLTRSRCNADQELSVFRDSWLGNMSHDHLANMSLPLYGVHHLVAGLVGSDIEVLRASLGHCMTVDLALWKCKVW